MSEILPFSQSCENNKDYILEVLTKHLSTAGQILEIAGGTGQHAVYFARHMTQLTWQTSDLADNVETLNKRVLLSELENLPYAVALDVTQKPWFCDAPSHMFTANSLHIMAESSVKEFFKGVKRHLVEGGFLFVYGPFKYQGKFTTKSNANFDLWLKARDPVSGIRDFETVNDYALEAGLKLIEDNALPANNQLLVWRKDSQASD